jgi:hypothetical protein
MAWPMPAVLPETNASLPVSFVFMTQPLSEEPTTNEVREHLALRDDPAG